MLRERSSASWALVLAVLAAWAALSPQPGHSQGAQAPRVETALRQAIAQGGEGAGGARYNLAQWLWRQGRHAEAVETAREYLRTEPAGSFSKEARTVLCQARQDGRIVLRAFVPGKAEARDQAGSTPSRPEIIHHVKPVYSASARAANAEGVVILESLIDAEGCVQNVRLLKGFHPDLDQAAQDAVRQWVFLPARLEGEPVETHYTLTVSFKVDGSQKGRS